MTTAEAVDLLEAEGVPSSYYRFDGVCGERDYGIEKSGNAWQVYFCENGERAWVRRCIDEEEACRVFVEHVRALAAEH
jgi:23S rRNA A1618 N6-methylase RlmF